MTAAELNQISKLINLIGDKATLAHRVWEQGKTPFAIQLLEQGKKTIDEALVLLNKEVEEA